MHMMRFNTVIVVKIATFRMFFRFLMFIQKLVSATEYVVVITINIVCNSIGGLRFST